MPNACPSWRAALTMPDAIPALRRSTALMAIVEIGVPHSPIAAPSSAKSHQIAAIGVFAESLSSPSVATPAASSPAITGSRSPVRCSTLPVSVATTA